MTRLASYQYAFAALLLACWPVWPWYVTATLDGSNDFAGLLAAVTVGVVSWLGGDSQRNSEHQNKDAPDAQMLAVHRTSLVSTAHSLGLPALALLGYMLASIVGVPSAFRAAFASLAIAALLSRWRFGTYLYLPIFALCLLALPLAASIQFYLGYPLRILAGYLSVALLQLNGLHVLLEGTLINWHGQFVAIDAPCSGVKMMWSSLYLSYTLAALYRLSSLRTMLVIMLAVAIVICANALRAAALFYTETGLVALPSWTHSAIGMVCFAFALGLIGYGIGVINNWQIGNHSVKKLGRYL